MCVNFLILVNQRVLYKMNKHNRLKELLFGWLQRWLQERSMDDQLIFGALGVRFMKCVPGNHHGWISIHLLLWIKLHTQKPSPHIRNGCHLGSEILWTNALLKTRLTVQMCMIFSIMNLLLENRKEKFIKSLVLPQKSIRNI